MVTPKTQPVLELNLNFTTYNTVSFARQRLSVLQTLYKIGQESSVISFLIIDKYK